ncbi:YopX family protein [Bacillus paralicheniformis]|uniref:YopX family protein n=1 Tax=Bacillus paralicheniformis TaxID=1648923 RepID=UPI0021A793EE|nr:YopX family protein [Bacillus paralicheniformis]UWS63399.1 YopX family protein [Bacillus paralicheniformis]
MDIIKIRYTFRHKGSGNIEMKWYSIGQLEERAAAKLSPVFSDEYELISRDLYTGLKDKNDREIYEKDIAEESYINPMTGKKVIDRYVIEWESGILKMKHIDNPKGADRYLWMRFNEVEVIGNVYQNPELLGATK